MAYQALALILPLVTAPYVSRVLGSEGLGTCSYTNSVASYFVMFAMLGVNNYGNRAIAMARNDRETLRKTFWEIWSLQAALAVLMLAIYVCYAVFAEGCALTALVWIPYVFSAALDVNWLFFGLEKFKITVTRNFVIKLATFGLTFVLVRGEYALICYLVLLTTSFFLSSLVLWPFVLKEFSYERPAFANVLKHLKPNLVLFVPVVAVSLYTVFDKIMLTWLSGVSATGIFENGLKVAQMPFTLITALDVVCDASRFGVYFWACRRCGGIHSRLLRARIRRVYGSSFPYRA